MFEQILHPPATAVVRASKEYVGYFTNYFSVGMDARTTWQGLETPRVGSGVHMMIGSSAAYRETRSLRNGSQMEDHTTVHGLQNPLSRVFCSLFVCLSCTGCATLPKHVSCPANPIHENVRSGTPAEDVPAQLALCRSGPLDQSSSTRAAKKMHHHNTHCDLPSLAYVHASSVERTC